MSFIRENNLFNLKCPHFVRDSAQILAQIIEEMSERELKVNAIEEAKKVDNDKINN